MSDLLTDARETIDDISSRRPGQTHYEGCRTEHVGCLLAELVAEIERLREAIRRIAEQDATLSVCDGNVTVQVDATLTDEPLAYCCRLLADSQGIIEAKRAEIERLRLTDAEREAVRLAADAYDLDFGEAECEAIAATLRGLLERQPSTPPTHTTPTECTVPPECTSLTDAERKAVEECYEWAMTADHRSLAATLRGLGERLK